MKRQDYIKNQAVELKKLFDKREKFSKRYTDGDLSHKQAQKMNAELNFLGMDISKTEERLAFALGLLRPENAQKEYRPSAFHVYSGIQAELEKIKFD